MPGLVEEEEDDERGDEAAGADAAEDPPDLLVRQGRLGVHHVVDEVELHLDHLERLFGRRGLPLQEEGLAQSPLLEAEDDVDKEPAEDEEELVRPGLHGLFAVQHQPFGLLLLHLLVRLLGLTCYVFNLVHYLIMT